VHGNEPSGEETDVGDEELEQVQRHEAELAALTAELRRREADIDSFVIGTAIQDDAADLSATTELSPDELDKESALSSEDLRPPPEVQQHDVWATSERKVTHAHMREELEELRQLALSEAVAFREQRELDRQAFLQETKHTAQVQAALELERSDLQRELRELRQGAGWLVEETLIKERSLWREDLDAKEAAIATLTAENQQTRKDLEQLTTELQGVYGHYGQAQRERDSMANELQLRIEASKRSEQVWKEEKLAMQQNIDQLHDELEHRSAAMQMSSELQLAMERLEAKFDEVSEERCADAKAWEAREALLEQQAAESASQATILWQQKEALVEEVAAAEARADAQTQHELATFRRECAQQESRAAVQAWVDEPNAAPAQSLQQVTVPEAVAARPQTAPTRHSVDAAQTTTPKEMSTRVPLLVDEDAHQSLIDAHAAVQARLEAKEDELHARAAELTAQQEHAAEDRRKHRSEHRALQREKEKVESKLRSELKEVKAKARAAEVRELQWRDEWRMSSGVPGAPEPQQSLSDSCRWAEVSTPPSTPGVLRRPNYATAMRKKVLVASSPMLSLVKNWEHVELSRSMKGSAS